MRSIRRTYISYAGPEGGVRPPTLVGESGVGKTVLAKFVAWHNGMGVKEIQATRTYTLAHFDDDLRSCMKRAGVDKERLVILLDADGVQSAFLERMNALLAAGEVPGLWPADDLSRLLTQCRDARRSEGVGGDADDDAVVLKWFSSNVRRNLHVVFCLEDLCSASTTASPALFNRCVVDWFGTWSTSALAHVGDALLADVDVEQLGAWDERELSTVERLDRDALLQKASYVRYEESDSDEEEQPTTLKTALVAALVEVHTESKGTARDFVDCCRRFAKDVVERRELLEQRQQAQAGRPEGAGGSQDVAARQKVLDEKNRELEVQEAEAKMQLEKMVRDQQEAEAKQRQGAALSEELAVKSGDIAQRKSERGG